MSSIMKLLLVSLSLALTSVTPFAPSRVALYKPTSVLRVSSGDDLDDLPKPFNVNFADKFSNINFDDVLSNVDAIKANTMEGEVGQRGEIYSVAQAVIILCILSGGVPFIGDKLTILVGPGLFLLGAAAMVLGVSDLGTALTPWPVPPKGDTGLKTEGVYALIRHPLYAGVLAAMAGLSIITGSANRLLLTAILFYSLNIKAEYEEEEMTKKYPAYDSYKEAVPGRFFPAELVNAMPWSKKAGVAEEGMPWSKKGEVDEESETVNAVEEFRLE